MSTVAADTERGGAVPPVGASPQVVADLLRGARTAVLTGAGVSTDSGIPDYRGVGSPRRTPMTFQQFVGSHAARQRYWAGSHLGWPRFASARPNAGHTALARLEAAGLVCGVITQNVDGLHLRAGSSRVVDLHGSLDRVSCLDCGQQFARSSVAEWIDSANPALGARAGRVNPDGDADVGDAADFVVPHCTVCSGMLKPDIVYFGELVPRDRFDAASDLIASADALLIAGSSLAVNSGIRLLEQAFRRRLPVIIINRGPTKGDRKASVKMDAGTSESLTAIAERLLD